jgi:pilus assembly protein Flp/PilA
MRKLFKAFIRDERGVTSLEYALLAGMVVVALGSFITQYDTGVKSLFANVITYINQVKAPSN